MSSNVWSVIYKKEQITNRKCTEKSDQISKQYTTSELHRTPEISWIAITSIQKTESRHWLKLSKSSITSIKYNMSTFILQVELQLGVTTRRYIKRTAEQISENTTSQRILDMWNSLPKQVIETKTVNTFKSQLNHWKNLEIKFSPDVYRSEEQTNLSRRVQGVNQPI